MDTRTGTAHGRRRATPTGVPPGARRASATGWRRAIAVAIAAVLVMLGLSTPALADGGRVIDGAITNVTFDKTTGQDWQVFKLTLAWAVPDGSQGGDTFSLVLPAEIEPQVTTTFNLDETKDGATNTVAVGTWDLVNGENRATFTLTDYVNDKSSVSGDAWFTVKFTKEMSVGTTTLLFDLGAKGTVEIPMTKDPKGDPGNGYGTTDRTKLYKSGTWTDTKKEGTTEPSGALTWTISTPGSYTTDLTDMHLVDTIGAGHTMTAGDLAGIEVWWENIASTGGSTWARAAVPRDVPKLVTYRVFADNGTEEPARTATGVFTASFADGVLTVDIPLVPAREVVRVVYKTSLVDVTATTFSNSAHITATATVPGQVSTTVKRTQAGGKGVTIRNSYLVVEKVDAADGTPLAGAYFDLYSGDTLVTTLGPTGADGTVTSGKLDNGGYRLVETIAPAGYVLDPAPRAVSIAANATLTVTVQNTLAVAPDVLGDLHLTKSDADDLSKLLPGAVYRLTPVGGGASIDLPATGKDGVAVLADLAIGDYLLTERVAPVGYELSTESVPVTIDADLTNVSVTDEAISEVLALEPAAPADPSVVAPVASPLGVTPVAAVLAATGITSVLPVVVAALVLLAAGGSALALRRRVG